MCPCMGQNMLQTACICDIDGTQAQLQSCCLYHLWPATATLPNVAHCDVNEYMARAREACYGHAKAALGHD